MEQVHLIISGRVQRVGFRRFVVLLAEQLNLSGWVRNRRCGDVEVFIAGSTDALSVFIGHCKKGPLFASVTGIQFLPIDDFCINQLTQGSFKVLETV